jgi:hypothetical protein
MGDDKGLKSAFELAMERLQRKDAAAGVVRAPVTEAQKAAIAEIRNLYEAKLAEIELLHRGQMRALVDPVAHETREDEYRRDRERLIAEREAKIEKARAGGGVAARAALARLIASPPVPDASRSTTFSARCSLGSAQRRRGRR